MLFRRINAFFFWSFSVLLSLSIACNKTADSDPKPELQLTTLKIGDDNLLSGTPTDVPLDKPIIVAFSASINTDSFKSSFTLVDDQQNSIPVDFNFFNENKNVSIYPVEDLKTFTEYTIDIKSSLVDADGGAYQATQHTFRTLPGTLVLESIMAGGINLMSNQSIRNVPLDLQIKATFSGDLDAESINSNSVVLRRKGGKKATIATVVGNVLMIQADPQMEYWKEYSLQLDTTIVGTGAVDFDGFNVEFTTGVDSTLKFPEISDEELLTKVQEQTFKYFWDFGHPTSGLARERNTSGETVTIGGSGFGVMSIIVGIERGFITRQEGVDRLLKIINFLQTKADRFHGVWSHWLNGTTGVVRPFSADDDGGDLVETAFMVQGLLTVRQYMNEQDPTEAEIISKINTLWEEVEWDWYRQNGQNVLYWHWSPNFGWQKNHKISGWNESLIVYVLAASSPTHTIDKTVYTSGWARGGAMRNGNDYYDITLPLGSTRGGPLFFSHYSFLGLDPRNLSDTYAAYWEQNVAHSKINHLYCVSNPKRYVGYSANCWGLTASDNNTGYSAHSPTNDRGVITPTAAISSIPYTPEESMAALRFFYYILGDELWGEYGFYDAFNPSVGWTASSFLAIDQGPIVVMIENHRTGLLWDLFMSAPEVKEGLTKLGFTYE